ncbi:MAG: hypothetical protein LBP62_07545 [Clostridiales bacterium]|nr:hypothetical protein [Clostridiales bacterium]
MKEEFQKYLDKQFANYKKSKEMSDFKNEVLTNLAERYDEFKALGFSDRESYDKSIEKIGDFTQILKDIDARTPTKTVWAYSKLVMSVSALYFVLLFIAYFTTSFLSGEWGKTWLIILIGCVVFAVALLAFSAKNAAVTGKSGKKRFHIMAIFLTVTILAYFTVSFATGAWAKTWLIFIDGLAVWYAADLVLAKLKDKNKNFRIRADLAVMKLSIASYLTVSVLAETVWRYSWLILLGGLAAVFALRAAAYYKKYMSEIKSGK